MYKNRSKYADSDFKYFNSQRGFIVTKISDVFKPSRSLKKKDRNNIWKPECSKEDIYQKLMNYIIIMKEKYPLSDGYLCNYCKKPFTYLTNFTKRGEGYQNIKRKYDPAKEHNFAIDRWDSRITYTYNNIRFCCLSCNNRKKNSNIDDWKNFIGAQYENR
jgi:hypothetical protein